jgi:hypothetical protein
MIKIDLVTGFLGSGKTTFIKKYAKHFLDKGLKIGILENDYGAINIDLMLLGDIMGDNCELEMIIGGGDLETHKRRFRTKLIAMAMSGYDRIIVEPSGIFEPEEFFDLLYEEPLDKWYEIGSVITIVDVSFAADISDASEYLLATQLACAGALILSKKENYKFVDEEGTISYLNSLLERIKCNRRLKDADIIPSEGKFENCDFEMVSNSGYVLSDYEKKFYEIEEFNTVFIMNKRLNREELEEKAKRLFQNPDKYGDIIRIKGFTREDEGYSFINMTKNNTEISRIERGQDIFIVIGRHLAEVEIRGEFD